MQDEPRPEEIIAAVARFLREEVAPGTSGRLSFNARVAANALEMTVRQIETAPLAEAAELASLRALLGQNGDLKSLNAELSARLADGRMGLETPGLAAHLWRVTLTKLAVDQPGYWGYRAALADRAETP
ncbi:MAG: hypothetical protein KGL69_02855 [Alphaproteobacteria bacterium]|nr:hypothetical protein [Alphaproteobacteria bacterium]